MYLLILHTILHHYWHLFAFNNNNNSLHISSTLCRLVSRVTLQAIACQPNKQSQAEFEFPIGLLFDFVYTSPGKIIYTLIYTLMFLIAPKLEYSYS